MKRILMITRSQLSFSRGYSQNIVKTAEALAKLPMTRVCVLSLAKEQKTVQDIRADKNVLHADSLQLDMAEYDRFSLTAVWKKRKDFDILYFRDPYMWFTAFVIRAILGKKIIFEAHGSHEWRGGLLFWHSAVAAAHGLVFITKKLADYYNSRKPFVITHAAGFEISLFEDFSKENARSKLHLPQNTTLILYAGSFLWYSWEVLIRMMYLLPPPSTLILVGVKDDEKKIIDAVAREADITGRVLCIARQTPRVLPLYVCAADILVNPLRIVYPGSISSKLYEYYLPAGRPIISTRGGANEEILSHEINALLVDLSAESFASAVTRLLRDNTLSEKLSHNARESAKQYTWEKRADDIALLIKRI